MTPNRHIIFPVLLALLTNILSAQTLKPYLQCATDHSIWVNWRTSSGTESTVFWGTSPDNLDHTISGNYHTFAANYLWHGAKITGLQANSVYYYRVKTGTETSAVFRFRTYQNPTTANGHIRVLIVGDTQHPVTAHRTFAAAKLKMAEKYGAGPLEDQVQLILKQGDNVDAGVLSQYISMHFDPLSNLSGNIPTMTVLGNHEYYQNSDLSYFFPHFEYDDADIQYNGIAGQNGEHYYAFRVGSVLFCMLNSNEWWASQTNWLKNVMNSANADPSVKWVFGTAHHPLRCENYVSDGSAYIRDEIMPVLRASEKSAMYTSGHSHMYARGSSRDSAVWEMISGGGGLIQNWNENVEQDYPDVQRSFDVWTYQIMDIDLDAQTMDIECYSIGNEEYTLDNVLVDSFHRYFGKAKPAKPGFLTAPNDTLTLPFTFESTAYNSSSGELNNSTEFEVASESGDFEHDLILNLKRDFENYYQIESPAYWSPIDQMAGTNIFQMTIDSTQVFQGKNWIRVRHRDRNLEWSEWSEPLPFYAENGKEPLALEPIAWWHFNGDAVDATGHGFDGTVPATGVTFPLDAPIRGQVAQFNNTQSIMVRSGATASAGQPVLQMTVSGWVKVNAADEWGGFIGCVQDNGSYEKGWVLGTRYQKFSFALMTEGGSTMTYLTDTDDFNLGEWYYVTATYNGVTMKLFVNGELKNTSTAQSGDIVYAGLATDWFGIGSYVDADENWLHDGALDELILWERALPDAEVASLYTNVSNVAPEVVITSPVAQATYFAPASIQVSADASDIDNHVSLVEFYSGALKIYEDTDGAPYGFLWENVPAGIHTLTARATDNLGAKTVSAPVDVVVLVDLSPTVTCPADVTVSTDSVNCSGEYLYTIEFHNGLLTQTEGLESGDFPLGLTYNEFIVTDTAGNAAACSFNVFVIDETAPICTAPANVIVACEVFDPSLTEYGFPATSDNCCSDTVLTSVDWAQFDSTCHRGVITRVFHAFDCSGNSSICSQRIEVTYPQDYYIRFPDDVIVTTCTPDDHYGEPQFFGADCALMSATYEDMIFGLSDVCFTITRQWTIINWCDYDPTTTFVHVPNPQPVQAPMDPANMVGPVVSACDAPAPWNPTVTKRFWSDTAETNYCEFWSPNPGKYLYNQIIRVIDLVAPNIADCPATPPVFADSSLNNGLLWNNVFNPAQPAQDLTETEVQLSITASDDCSDAGVNIEYELYLDLDGDDVTETVVKSVLLPGWNNVNYGNIIGLGQARQFDNRPVAANQKWGFAIHETVSGNEKTARVAFNTAQSPNTYTTPQLPQRTHRIKWLVEDGCGNTVVCDYEFTIQEGIHLPAPTATCPADVTVETEPGLCSGTYSYTVDFSNGVLSQTAGLPSGNFPGGVTLNEFTVTDSLGNTASCSFSVIVEDHEKPSCIPPADVTVSCDDLDAAMLNYGNASSTDNCCTGVISSSADWSQFDTSCQRGVVSRLFTTYDCSGNTSQCSQRIQVDHVQDYYIRFPDDVLQTYCTGSNDYGEPLFFGQNCELLSTTYHDIYTIPVLDACFKFERTWKVINWCAYDPTLVLINVPNPQPSAITSHANNLPGPIVSACGTLPPWNSTVVKINPTDAVATDFCTYWNANANGYLYKQYIKIIDAVPPVMSNCPAAPISYADTTDNDPALWNNAFDSSLPPRDLTELEIDLSITATDDCSGSNIGIYYQLFLDLDNNGTFESIVYWSQVGAGGLGWNNVLYNNANGAGQPREFDNRPVPADEKWGFTAQQTVSGINKTAAIRFNTMQSPNSYVIPQLPQGTHKIKWFVTDNCGNESVCEHVFTIGQGPTTATDNPETNGFTLYQNEPNPFNSTTSIGFKLPAAAEATLSVYDMNGRPLFRKTGWFGEGYNSLRLEGEWLSAPGVLYYKLESGANVAWRKMILTR